MPRENRIRAILADGRRTQGPGRAFDAAVMVLKQPRLSRQLIQCLWDEDEVMAGQAADALETLAGERPQALQPWKQALLGLLVESKGIKLRWHLGLIVTRLKLTRAECRRVADVLSAWLDDQSSIVKTCAMQGLAELTRQDQSMTEGVLDQLRALARSGTPAMRARGRTLLKQMENGTDLTWKRIRLQARQAARLINCPRKELCAQLPWLSFVHQYFRRILPTWPTRSRRLSAAVAPSSTST
jgi:hypothetical protein